MPVIDVWWKDDIVWTALVTWHVAVPRLSNIEGDAFFDDEEEGVALMLFDDMNYRRCVNYWSCLS